MVLNVFLITGCSQDSLKASEWEMLDFFLLFCFFKQKEHIKNKRLIE